MAVAVRREVARAPRPHLALVPRLSKRPNNSARARQRARQNFVLFSVAVALVSTVGVARVWLSVRAIEASFEASQLRADIKSERYEGDMLEVRQSALGSPSRIRAIAGRAMGMAPAKQVTYIDLTEAVQPPIESQQANAAEPSVVKAVVAVLRDLTAGDARVLFVGDVGVASTR